MPELEVVQPRPRVLALLAALRPVLSLRLELRVVQVVAVLEEECVGGPANIFRVSIYFL